MTNTITLDNKTELHDRGTAGFLTYANGMDASKYDKAKIISYVRGDEILEVGCGNGAVLELLAQTHPRHLTGMDLSDTMLGLAAQKDYETQITLQKGDILTTPLQENSLDSIVFCSVMHEVYSYNDYDTTAIETALQKAYTALKQHGRIIIRDGTKPEDGDIYMQFKNNETEEKFYRFSKEFGPGPISYEADAAHTVKLRRADAMEFLSKYRYEKNWQIEVKEQFGIYTRTEYEQVLEKNGFHVVHSETYLLDWLQHQYEKDVILFTRIDDRIIPEQYPDSTMLLVAEKVEQ